ncbi:MAG: hypothetical protein QXR30_03775 [Candidatus Woesearchaeota archaeon]
MRNLTIITALSLGISTQIAQAEPVVLDNLILDKITAGAVKTYTGNTYIPTDETPDGSYVIKLNDKNGKVKGNATVNGEKIKLKGKVVDVSEDLYGVLMKGSGKNFKSGNGGFLMSTFNNGVFGYITFSVVETNVYFISTPPLALF